jgi:Tfp pilus assembly protein PilN
MINLLPPIEKIKRRQEKRLKLIWILGILIIASVLCFVFILLSIKFYIANQIKTQDILVNEAKEKNVKVNILQGKIKSVNSTLSGLNNFYQNQFPMTDFLERISQLLLEDMYLERLSYQADNSQITFTCYAPTIDSIYQFREKMRSQEDFKDVNFVLPDWLEPDNITFRVSFKLVK